MIFFLEFVKKINYVILSILILSFAFAIHNEFFKHPLYESKATILKSNNILFTGANNEFETNSLIENFSNDQIPDLSRLQLLPSIVKSDIFIERILRKDIATKSNNKKTNILSILTKEKIFNNNIEKINYAKSVLKRSINFIDSELSIALKVTSLNAELAQNISKVIIDEIIELNTLFKKETLNIKRKTAAQKIRLVNENLLSQETKLEDFLRENTVIGSPNLSLEYETLKRDIDIKKEIYIQLSRYFDYINVEINSLSKNSLTILDHPSKPLFAFNKNLTQSIIRGSLLGLVLSSFFILFSFFTFENSIKKINLTF